MDFVTLQNEDVTALVFDLVGSTRMKSEYGQRAIAQLVFALYKEATQRSHGHDGVKFTGDGAVVVWKTGDTTGRAKHAAEAASAILEQVEMMNLIKGANLDIRVKAGIASGDCHVYGDFTPHEYSGLTIDLAARLCSAAEVDGILIDSRTADALDIAGAMVELTANDRILDLKGISKSEIDAGFFNMRSKRLMAPDVIVSAGRGLVALYPDRGRLSHDFSPARIIHRAKPGSTVIVAGRTLVAWSRFSQEMRAAARERSVSFLFVVGDSDALDMFDERQQEEIRHDLSAAMVVLGDLAWSDSEHFTLRRPHHVLLDGVTCAEMVIGADRQDSTMIVLQDVNASSGDKKPSLVFACECDTETVSDECIAHGLLNRTMRIAETDTDPEGAPSQTATEEALRAVMRDYPEGSPHRSNSLADLARRSLDHVAAANDQRYSDAPPPLCVQLQISSTCSTRCLMCDHWKQPSDQSQMTVDEWRELVRDLAGYGVQSLVLSGGEPLDAPENLQAILAAAAETGLGVGIITAGCSRHLIPESSAWAAVVPLIKEHASWMSLSIDGLESHDSIVRNPYTTMVRESSRFELIRQFTDAVQGGPKISVTCTLQNSNAHLNPVEYAKACGETFGASFVNFKFATGAQGAIEAQRAERFLLSQEVVTELLDTMYEVEPRVSIPNSLGYLRRSFASGVFQTEDVHRGEPLASYYTRSVTQCFATWLFALVDGNGDVYPCCHLFRDNHVMDSNSNTYRDLNLLGNVRSTGFPEIWNSVKYAEIRKRLERIEPQKLLEKPCGECTRHCQTNRGLTQVARMLRSDDGPSIRRQLETMPDPGGPVWL